MLEPLAETIARFFAQIVGESLFGGLFKFIQAIGLRIYSLFTGTITLTSKELRIKYDDKILPWFFDFLTLGMMCYTLIAIVT